MGAQIVNFRPAGEHGWTLFAECGKKGAAPMFPADGDVAAIEEAKANCRVCPVLAECLETALDRGESWGIWGGLTPDERSALRRNGARRARKTGEPRETVAEMADAAALDIASAGLGATTAVA